jgi:putative ABC transport system permease protein
MATAAEATIAAGTLARRSAPGKRPAGRFETRVGAVTLEPMLGLALLLVVQAPTEVAVERRLAEQFRLSVGDTIELTTGPDAAPRPFLIRAVYQARPDPATALRGEYRTLFHLPDLAALLGFPDRIDRIAVKARPGVPAESVAARLNTVAFGFRAYPSRQIAEQSSRTFAVVSRFHRAIGFIAIMASAIFLLCIMLLKVEERRLDTAVMRMIGIGRRTIVAAIVLEACFVAVVGSLVGVLLAGVAAEATNWIYRRKFETALTFAYLTPGIVATGIAISLGLGVVAGFLAALRLANARPLALWRRA